MIKTSVITMTTLFLFSCNQGSEIAVNEKDSTKTETNAQSEDMEIVSSLNIIETNAIFNTTSSADGEWDESYDEEIVSKSEIKKVKDNRILWCYDTQDLIMIDIIGSGENIDIYFNNKLLVEKTSFNTNYSLATEKIDTGGEIELRGMDGAVLHTIKIEYEGCL